MQDQFANPKVNMKKSTPIRFFLLLDNNENKTLAAANDLFDLFNTISRYRCKNDIILTALPISKLLLPMWESLISHRCGWLLYLRHIFKYRSGKNSENWWRNLMNEQKCFKLTIVICVLTVLLLKKTSRVINENIRLDNGMNSSWCK